jgi:hypothetical protein
MEIEEWTIEPPISSEIKAEWELYSFQLFELLDYLQPWLPAVQLMGHSKEDNY